MRRAMWSCGTLPPGLWNNTLARCGYSLAVCAVTAVNCKRLQECLEFDSSGKAKVTRHVGSKKPALHLRLLIPSLAPPCATSQLPPLHSPPLLTKIFHPAPLPLRETELPTVCLLAAGGLPKEGGRAICPPLPAALVHLGHQARQPHSAL